VHGTTTGLVFARDYDVITYDGISPSFSYRTHEMNRGSKPTNEQSFVAFSLEYLSTRGPAVTITALTDNLSLFQFQSLPLSDGLPATLQTATADFKLRGTHHGFWLTGGAPVLIRSMTPELIIYGNEDTEGQP
jgi:hypothetical protein